MNVVGLATKYFGPAPVASRLCRLREGGLSLPLEVTGRYHMAELVALKQEDFEILAVHAPGKTLLGVCGSPLDGRDAVRIRDYYAPILERVTAAGAKRLIEHLGNARYERDQYPEALAGLVLPLVELAGEFGLVVSLESSPSENALRGARQFASLYATLPPCAHYTLDVCHVMGCGETIAGILEAIGERLDHVHLMDVDFVPVPDQVRMGDWLPVGSTNSLEDPIRRIHESGFRGPWIVETEAYYFSRVYLAIQGKLEGLGLGRRAFRTAEELEDEVLRRSIRWLRAWLDALAGPERNVSPITTRRE